MSTPVLHAADYMELTETRAAHNYHPLPVVLTQGQGAWVMDTEGTRYLDCLAGYSALNFGHCHPRLVEVATRQVSRLTLTSRAFYSDQLGLFARDLTDLCGKEVMLPMNSGAEAVETALKVARRWGHEVKGVPEQSGTIVVMAENFHGRTTTIVSFSTDELARDGYGPFTPGFVVVPFGDADALAQAMGPDTIAVLLEPIQGEAGVLIPPPGFLAEVRRLCTDHNALMIADEIQSGLARTGRTFAVEHEDVVPDIYVLGKALGGGIMPVSAIAADADVMQVITPGRHGSTFGGNPLAAALGSEVVAMLNTGEFQQLATERGRQLADGLADLHVDGITEVRCRGLWAGLDISPDVMTARELAKRLMQRGVLAKDAHTSTIRLAPPLVATADDMGVMVEAIAGSLRAA